MVDFPSSFEALGDEVRLRRVIQGDYHLLSAHARAVLATVRRSPRPIDRVSQLLTEWGALEREPGSVPLECAPAPEALLNFHRTRHGEFPRTVIRAGREGVPVEETAATVHNFYFSPHAPEAIESDVCMITLLLETGLLKGKPVVYTAPCHA